LHKRLSQIHVISFSAGADRGQRAGCSVIVTAAVHADDMVEDRAKVSDYIGDDG
jgi:hypothetical protein